MKEKFAPFKFRPDTFLYRLMGVQILAFIIARVCFMCYNHSSGLHDVGDIITATGQAFVLDFVTALLLLSPIAFLTLAACLHPRLPIRWLSAPFCLIAGLFTWAVAVADTVLYDYWHFKLGMVAVYYAMYPEGAANSANHLFIFAAIATGIALSILMTILYLRIIPRRLIRGRQDGFPAALIVGLAALSYFTIDSGVCFRENTPIFINHAAKNSTYHFVESWQLGKSLKERYRYMDDAVCDSLIGTLFPQQTEDVTDTLLRCKRPDILLVFLESFGGVFVEELGGVPGVAPNLSRLIPQGILWDNYYSNSIRTDRGSVTLYSGCLPHPDFSLMKEEKYHAQLPSLLRSLAQEGYRTVSLMGQTMKNMGKDVYFRNMGFQELLDHTAFTAEEHESIWGVDDHISAQKAVRLMAEKDSCQRMFLAYQTVSSHEPWHVPYQRLEDPVLNTFAYVDQCIGDMVDSLQALPLWENLLVIILPDHGCLYHQDFQMPEYYHSPMLWLGGAISSPRRISVLMSQSDVAATLLSQLGIAHTEYRWSRNVLSQHYTMPFVYCNYPDGMMWLDPRGTTILDLPADKSILERPCPDPERARRAKA
ncbi:MAG: LTA synthase family protein, partial [Bacteroidaceae bacterium]|nr:LTA synthase family protein [Bacteroidaceae bacterium]